MRLIFLIIFILPVYLFGQNQNFELDSISKSILKDTAARPVYFRVEEMPKTIEGERIETYIVNQTFVNNKYPCCIFKGHIQFVIEPDSCIANRNVVVRAVHCEYGLLYEGQEIKEMERRIHEILDDLKIIPGKIGDENVAVQFSIPIHVDCYTE